jgi:hypothetical protein
MDAARMRVLPQLPALPLRGEPRPSEESEELAEALVRVVPMSGRRRGWLPSRVDDVVDG